MRILIFGIDNEPGKKVAEYALETEKFTVFGFANRADTTHIDNIEVIKGDFHNKEQVHKSLRGKDLVISTLGLKETSTKYAVAMENIIQGMNTRGIKRLLAVAHKGILQVETEKYLFEEKTFSAEAAAIAREHLSVYQQLRDSKLDWTLVCPQKVVSGNRSKEYRVQLDYNPEEGNQISQEDLADFMVQEIKNGLFIHRRVGIAY